MKRLHVHVAVDDLAASIKFYSTMFAAAPSVLKSDYAGQASLALSQTVTTRSISSFMTASTSFG